MPRLKTKLEYNTFVKGLVTEASPLTFPDNSSIIDENMVLNRDGSRQRRLGMTYEPNYSLKEIDSIQRFDTVIHSYTWKSVGNNANLDIAVVQVGNQLFFYDNNVSPISASPLNSGVGLTLTADANRKYDFTESYGKLLAAVGEEDIYIIEYDEVTDTISSSTFRLEIRDVFGVSDGLTPMERPQTLTPEHHYNLLNQSWEAPLKRFSSFFAPFYYYSRGVMCSNDITGTGATFSEPISYTYTKFLSYPSNSDILHALKLGSASHLSAVNSYSPWEMDKYTEGNTEASKGHYIIDLFNRGASRTVSVSGLPNDETVGGVTCISSFSGRVFYGVEVTSTNGLDDRSPDIGTMIFFSRSTNKSEDYGKCYSQNDPTSETYNDPLDTDGGFILIPDIGKLHKLAVLGSSIYVFSSKGVWSISGGDSPFSATNQNVSKICDFGAYSPNTVVAGESTISFWSSGGIYSLSLLEDAFRPTISNLTQNTIQSLYEDIDSTAKLNVVGTYDDISKQARWLYREGVLPSSKYYNRELIFDLNLQAFYLNKFQELPVTLGTCPYVVGYVDLSSTVFTDLVEDVFVSINEVEVGAGNQVTATIRTSDQTSKGSTKYWVHRDKFTSNKADLTVGGFYDLDYLDWSYTQDTSGNFGKDALAQLLTGHITGGDSEVIKKLNEITVYMKRTESGFTDDGSGNLTPIHPSSCLMQGQWEWTNHIDAGRWSNEIQVYRLPRAYVPIGAGDPFNYGFTVVKTKNRLRGKGSALSLLFKSEPLKDMHIYGWSFEITYPE